MSERIFQEVKSGVLNERRRFYDAVVGTVWHIEGFIAESDYSYGTGFCFSCEGRILTCAHVIKDAKKFSVVNLKNESKYSAKVVRRYTMWDMAILQLESLQGDKFDFIRFASGEDMIECGQQVHSIGNPEGFLGSFYSGRVAYPFSGYNFENFVSSSGVPNVTRNDTVGSWDGPILSYRNVGSLCRTLGKYDELDPNLPLIQISGYRGVDGVSGGPLFDNRGCVIGLLFGSIYHYSVAIHLSAVIHFIKDSNLNDDLNENEPKDPPKGTQSIKKMEDDQSKKRESKGDNASKELKKTSRKGWQQPNK